VSKSEVNHCFVSLPLNGLTINKCAVALLADFKVCGSLANFSNALANPSGYLVKRAPEASAKNSLFLETANWINVAAIGERIAKIIQ